MKLKYILPLCFFYVNACYADRFIQATKYENQEEVFIQGCPVTVSNKINSALMYQTCETLKDRKASFYFSLSNKTDKPINFLFSDLYVTDQSGKPIKIIHKKEIIAIKESSRKWKLIGSALRTNTDSINANNNGTVQYHSQTNDRFSSNLNRSENIAKSNIRTQNSSTTSGTIHVEALRQQALRNVQNDAKSRNEAIQANYDDWIYRLHNFYFDSTTIFPGSTYSANFHIDIDKNIEEKLQYLIFTYHIGEEEHKFCFYCGKKKTEWYQFFQ